MSWLYWPVVVEACLGANCSDGEQFVTSKTIPTQSKSSRQESETGSSTTPQSGTMLERSTGIPGLDMWISSLQVSHASHSASQEKDSEEKTDEIYGQIPSGSFVRYDRVSHCWRTFQRSFLLDTLEPFSESWPRAGTTCVGIAFQRQPSALRTREIDYGLWPTPRANERGDYQYDQGDHTKPRLTLQGLAKKFPTPTSSMMTYQDMEDARTSGTKRKLIPTPVSSNWKNRETSHHSRDLQKFIGGTLNPNWVEWLMGYPIGWTALEPLEMARFQLWLEQHG